MAQIFICKTDMHHYKNPQENAILERIDQVVGSILKTKDLENVTFDAVSPWSEILVSIAYAVWCSYHSTLQATPGQLVFGRNMLLDINFRPNYKEIWLMKKTNINYNNKCENAKRVQYDYEIVHHTYILRNGNYRKLEGEKLGQFRITQVNTNGSFRIQRVIVNEQINIQCLTSHSIDPPT